MGKETKIGLAILGVLVTIFGVLLVRHFRASESTGQWDESGPPAEPLATAKPDEPRVVMAQKESRGGALEALWDATPRTSPSSESEVPASSYLPERSEPAAEASADDIPAAGQVVPPAEPAAESPRPAGISPYKSREFPAADASSDASAADSPPDGESADEPPANPFHRPSAETPPDAREEDELPNAPDSEAVSDANVATEEPGAPAKLPPPLEEPRPLGDAKHSAPHEAQAVENSEPGEAEPQRSVPAAGRRLRSALVPSRVVPATATAPVPSGRDVYIVEEGDTLFDIARAKLGKAARWVEIYELNRDKLGDELDKLQPGLELRLPPQPRKRETMSTSGEPRFLR